MKPLGKVKIEWSPEFAYAIGLLTSDGCLSTDKRHIDLTSKDEEQLTNFLRCLNIEDGKITPKHSGNKSSKGLRVQFGDVNFYRFLEMIGLMPRKSKVIGAVNIPDVYFFDFLRGHYDGDGSFYSYWDPRWRSSFMFYTTFSSASPKFISWLQNKIFQLAEVGGHITKSPVKITYQLKYAKSDSLKLLKKMYYAKDVICLSRKRLKIQQALSIINQSF